MENFNKNITPFNKELQRSDVLGEHENNKNVFFLKDNEDKLIRIETFEKLSQLSKNNIKPIDLIIIGKNLFLELESYSIYSPVEFVIGKSTKNEDVVYEIVDKINGKNIDEIDLTDDSKQKIKSLCTSLARYYLDKFRNGGNFLADINNPSQYVYGNTTKKRKPDIFLVDTDLYINSGIFYLLHNIKWFLRHISVLENRSGELFQEAREILSKVIEEYLTINDFKEENTDNIKNEIIEIKSMLANDYSHIKRDEIGFIVSPILF